MANETLECGPLSAAQTSGEAVQVLRHHHVCEKLQVSSAKLFSMCAEGLFPRPFKLVPGGRAVGWLQADVDAWVLGRRNGGSK